MMRSFGCEVVVNEHVGDTLDDGGLLKSRHGGVARPCCVVRRGFDGQLRLCEAGA